jgi:hypothetical protein
MQAPGLGACIQTKIYNLLNMTAAGMSTAGAHLLSSPGACIKAMGCKLLSITATGISTAGARLLRAPRGVVDRLAQREVSGDHADEARPALRQVDVLLRDHAPADARAQHAARGSDCRTRPALYFACAAQ